MSVRIMSAIWETSIPPTEKLVFLALADCANDEGLAWPSIATVARKSGVSERTVQRAIRLGETCGLIKREEVKGKGCKYFLTPRHSVTPDTVSPVTNDAQTPDTVSPHPRHSVTQTINEPLEPSNTIVDADDPPVTSDEVVEAWNDTAKRFGLPAVRRMTDARRKSLDRRIRENTTEEWRAAIGAIERSPFLRGENPRGWRPNFDWMLHPGNFTKLIEGTYDRGQ